MKTISFLLMLVSLAACNENFKISVKNPTDTGTPGPITPGPVAPTPFITKWKTDNFGPNTTQITLYLTAGYDYDFVVDWGDGSTSEIDAWDDPDTFHDYVGAPGTYTVTMLGKIPNIHCNNGMGDGKKLIEITQWGNNEWEKLDRAFAYSNVAITATDAPDLSKVTSLEGLFEYTAFNNPIDHWNVSTITNMSYMFSNTTAFDQDLNSWDTSKVTTMSNMFYWNQVFNGNITSWNTSNVIVMDYMFYNADNFDRNINTWNTGKVTNMSFMFGYADKFNQNLNSWNTSQVEDMSSMFSWAPLFNGNITGWNTGNVTNMNGLFNNADAFNQNISSWNTSKVTDMSYIFAYTDSFNQNLSGWNISSVTNSTGFDEFAAIWDPANKPALTP